MCGNRTPTIAASNCYLRRPTRWWNQARRHASVPYHHTENSQRRGASFDAAAAALGLCRPTSNFPYGGNAARHE